MNPPDNDDLEQITHRLSQSQRVITAGTEDESSNPSADQFATYVPDPLVGKKLDGGRYHILSVLGRGGMSVVYKARQELVDRPVAIKTLTCQLLGDPVVLKRFQREIRALSKLSHPNIVTAFDCVVDSSGQPYFIMDYLDGESLAEVLNDEGKLAQERVRRIFLQVCQAVSHAHNLQVLHRDLKPANIMLLNIGTPDELVKVVDFGLAKLSEDAQKLTVTGEVWGSPSYMSPEQVYGKSNDARSDIYSIGCVMFEALAGKPPFVGATPIDTVMMQVNAAPPTFAGVDPKLEIHPGFEAIVLTCLQKNPDERFQSMVDVATALQELDLKSSHAIKAPPVRPQANAQAGAPSPVAPATMAPPQAPSIVGRHAPGADAAASPPVSYPQNEAMNQTGPKGGAAVPRNVAGAASQTDGGAHAPHVVRPSSAMRSGASQNNQRMLITAFLIFAAVLGLAALAATSYFLGHQGGSATQTGATAPAQTGATIPAQTSATVPPQNGTTAPAQTGATIPAQTSATVPPQNGTTTPAKTGATVPAQTGTGSQHAETLAPQTGAKANIQSTDAADIKSSGAKHAGKPNPVPHRNDSKPIVAKTGQPHKSRHQHASSVGDAGGNYVPQPVNDAQRWYDIQKSWSH